MYYFCCILCYFILFSAAVQHCKRRYTNVILWLWLIETRYHVFSLTSGLLSAHQSVTQSTLTTESLTQTNSLRPAAGTGTAAGTAFDLSGERGPPVTNYHVVSDRKRRVVRACAVTTADDERWQKMACNMSCARSSDRLQSRMHTDKTDVYHWARKKVPGRAWVPSTQMFSDLGISVTANVL